LRNRWATARPIPDAPPVTTAVFKPKAHLPERPPKHAYHSASTAVK
jgi:hypothetical protein